MSMCIPWIPVNYNVEVVYGLLVVFNHLVRFGPLVHKSYVSGDLLDAAAEREYGLFEFLYAAVGQPQVVENIGFVSELRLVWKGDF